MSSNTTLARPYARAAFESARDANALQEWSGKLDFAARVAGDAQVAKLIGNPRIKAAELQQLMLPEGESDAGTFAAFIGTLAANRRLPMLPEIARLFADSKREHEQVLHVTVRAAVPVEAAQAEALKAALQRRFNRRIELSSVVDASVIGGAVIDAGDVVIDASVRNRLNRLGQALAQ